MTASPFCAMATPGAASKCVRGGGEGPKDDVRAGTAGDGEVTE